MSAQRVEAPIVVTIGFAARAEGDGVAYAELGATDQREASLVRVAFHCRPMPALRGRDVAYAALHALAADLLGRGVRRVSLRMDDAAVSLDLAERRAVPAALAIPYVTLRCTLNRYREAAVLYAPDRTSRDLTARARAEVSLNIAA